MTKSFPATVWAVTVLFLLSTACQRTDTASPVTVVEGATLIDGISNQPVQDAVLVIDGTTIQSVGPSGSVSVPDGAERINAAGKTIIPGLFAMHTHVAMGEGMERNPRFYNRERIQRDANAYLYYGVTHVLSLGMDLEPMRGFLADQQLGRTSGARLYSSGIGFAAENGFEPGGFADVNRPRTVSEAQEMVRLEIEDKNVDAIKIWVDDVRGSVPKLDPEIYGAIIEYVRMRNIPVFAHMRDLEDGKELIRRGVTALVHTAPEVDEELLQLASDRGVTLMPTLAGAYGARAYAEGASFLSDPGLPHLFPASVLETLGSAEYQERIANSTNLDEARDQYERATDFVAQAAEAGIPFFIGSDSGPPTRFPGFWEHREMELLVGAGLTPMEAVRAATINGARVLGVDQEYGSLEAGKTADFVILNANPLTDIINSRNIDSVWMNGQPVDRATLGAAGDGS